MSLKGKNVRKIKGHEFTGVCVSEFITTKGEAKAVVECTVPGALGLLFIFRPDQLEVIP